MNHFIRDLANAAAYAITYGGIALAVFIAVCIVIIAIGAIF